MATRAIGLNSNVTLPSGYVLEVRRGTINLSQAPVDVTSTSDGGYQTVLGGIKSASGTAVGYPKYSGAGTAPGWSTISAIPASMTYTVAGGCTYTFNGLISGIQHGFDYKGNATVTFNFVSSGSITETWA